MEYIEVMQRQDGENTNNGVWLYEAVTIRKILVLSVFLAAIKITFHKDAPYWTKL